MSPAAFSQLSDEELFDHILRERAAQRDAREALGVLCERWRRPACFVIRRIQQSYKLGSPDDEPELYQDAVRKFIQRGLDQYRGVSEEVPGKAASPRTFFLRIVKHVAIDNYRRKREELADAPADDEGPEVGAHEAAQAMGEARRRAERAEATELYWAAFRRLQVEHPKEAAAWDLYHHRAVEDHEQCAKQLNISLTNSYKRVSRAQAYLKLYVLSLRDDGGTS